MLSASSGNVASRTMRVMLPSASMILVGAPKRSMWMAVVSATSLRGPSYSMRTAPVSTGPARHGGSRAAVRWGDQSPRRREGVHDGARVRHARQSQCAVDERTAGCVVVEVGRMSEAIGAARDAAVRVVGERHRHAVGIDDRIAERRGIVLTGW